MSGDRFSNKVDRKVKSIAPLLKRVEVITGVERRRNWSSDEKAAILVESEEEGAVISEVARRHGLRPQQLFDWRKKFRQRKTPRLQEAVSAAAEVPVFAPILIADQSNAHEAAKPSQVMSVATPAIEIVSGALTIRLLGHVDGRVLTTVLRAVKAAL